jgi:hypothetical protein
MMRSTFLLAALVVLSTIAACGSPSSSASADGGGATDVMTATDGGAADGTMPDSAAESSPSSPGSPDVGVDTGGTVVEGGTLHSTCAPGNVFVEPWFFAAGGGNNRDSVSGDVNNDGLTDLVALGSDMGAAFSVNVNKGNGAFAPAASYQGELSEGEGLALGDINGDGYADVLFPSFYDGSSSEPAVAVSLNNGNGTFSSMPVTFDAPGGLPEAILTADMNNDGKIDAVVSLQNSGLAVMLNQGGMLGAPIAATIPIDNGDEGHVMALADFDGDGKLDVATYNGAQGVCVALGMGNGSFGASSCYAGAPNILEIEAVAVGDLNGDGKPDIVQYNFDSTTDAADVFLNKGNGTFGSYLSVALPDSSIYDGQVADVNNDGKLDLVFYTAVRSVVDVEYGNGDGTFATNPMDFALGEGGANGGELLLGNFLGNGLPGFANVTFSNPGFQVLPAICRTTIPPAEPVFDGDGGVPKSTCATSNVTLAPFQTTTASVNGAGSSRAIDVNGDGKWDLAWSGGSQAGTAFSYQLSNGDGTFLPAVEVPGSLYGTVIAVGDFNGDGRADVVYGSINSESAAGLAVALNAGGTFQPPTFTPLTSGSAEFSALEVADLNNDGHLDAIVDGQLALGFGDGTFNALGVSTPFFALDSSRPYRFADLNGDGQLDVVFMQPAGNSGTGGFCSALNVGSGNFGVPSCGQAMSAQDPAAIALGDVNGDHKVDVVVVYNVMGFGLNVFLGKGDGTFQAPMTSNLPDNDANQVELGDFNNDGNLDLLVWFVDDGQFTLLPGAGNGMFAATGQNFAGAAGEVLDQQIAVGDFAGDGLLGFAITNVSRPGIDLVLAKCSP